MHSGNEFRNNLQAWDKGGSAFKSVLWEFNSPKPKPKASASRLSVSPNHSHSLRFTICKKSVASKSQPSNSATNPTFFHSIMETLSFCVGIIGDIISVLLFLSPARTFWRIVKHRSTEEFDSLPYICTLLNSSLWTYYGITRPGSYLVAAVNAFGVVVETVYVSLFLLFAPLKMRVRTAILAGILDVGFLLAVILVTHLAMDGDRRIEVIGLLGAGLNVVMYGSPLAAMKRVVMTGSVEYMPFLLSLFVFLNGGVWTLYAVLVRDWFLGVPNGAGFILGIAQLLLYAFYQVRGSSSKPHSPRSKTISSSSSHHDHHDHHAQPLLSSPTTDPIHINA